MCGEELTTTTFWALISSTKLLQDPFFFYESDMLRGLDEYFTSSIDLISLQEIWFQHDGVPPCS